MSIVDFFCKILRKMKSLILFKSNSSKQRVICDTNVWYNIAIGNFIPPADVVLVPTSFTLFELVSTEKIASDPKLIQKVILAIRKYGRSIIPVNPYDFVIMNHDSSFKGDDKLTFKMLEEFSKVVNMDMSGEFELDSDLKKRISEQCKISREANENFANYCNDKLPELRKKIRATTGIKAHLMEDTSTRIKTMVLGFFTNYVKEQNINFDPEKIDEKNINLFLKVTENFFKHLETTKNMKVDVNDAIDWLNMLYVRPGDKYLTFEKSWKRYITEDSRIKDYLYQQ